MSMWVDTRRIEQKFGLKIDCRRECVQGHSWWDFALPANGVRHDHDSFDTWLAERIEDIQAGNRWRVIGFNMSGGGEKIGLFAKDVRTTRMWLEIEGLRPLDVTNEHVEAALAKLGIRELVVRSPL